MSDDFAPMNDDSRANSAPKIPCESINLLDAQCYEQRKSLFRYGQVVIGGLYVVFFIVLLSAIFCPVIRGAIAHYPHLLALPMALLIVPSFLFWGAIRAVYRVPSEKEAVTDILKASANHPIN